jgi:hypothetical protein
MKRTELETRITDASDGILTPEELHQLETNLQEHPDLLADYHAIMQLPEIEPLYPKPDKSFFTARIAEIRNQIKVNEKVPVSSPVFYEFSLVWFKRYALAASLMIVAITSVFSLMQPDAEYFDSAVVIDELFYPTEERAADVYVIYLDDFTLD